MMRQRYPHNATLPFGTQQAGQFRSFTKQSQIFFLRDAMLRPAGGHPPPTHTSTHSTVFHMVKPAQGVVEAPGQQTLARNSEALHLPTFHRVNHTKVCAPILVPRMSYKTCRGQPLLQKPTCKKVSNSQPCVHQLIILVVLVTLLNCLIKCSRNSNILQ